MSRFRDSQQNSFYHWVFVIKRVFVEKYLTGTAKYRFFIPILTVDIRLKVTNVGRKQ